MAEIAGWELGGVGVMIDTAFWGVSIESGVSSSANGAVVPDATNPQSQSIRRVPLGVVESL